MLKTMLALAVLLVSAHAFADDAVIVSLKGAAAVELDNSLHLSAESKEAEGFAYEKTFPGMLCMDSTLSHLVGCEIFRNPGKGAEL